MATDPNDPSTPRPTQDPPAPSAQQPEIKTLSSGASKALVIGALLTVIAVAVLSIVVLRHFAADPEIQQTADSIRQAIENTAREADSLDAAPLDTVRTP